MAKNKIYDATVKATGEKIQIYVLKRPHPSKEFVWCNYANCRITYRDSYLDVIL